MRLESRVRRTATVAVVGAGFSGVLTAIHLRARHPGVTVRLIEQADRFGPGRAYAAANGAHLLNVRASNMSAFPDRPDHFVAWLAAQGERTGGDSFVDRGRYGEYLQSLLRDAIAEEGCSGRLLLEHDEATAVEPHGGGWRLRLAMGRTLEADAVVLAVGLGPPRVIPGLSAAARASAAYVGDPWSVDPDTLPGGDILLVGSGLTMVDVALALARPDRRLVAISRRGLLPHSHAVVAPAQLPAGPLDTPRQALRALRVLAGEAGWRSAVDGIRPLTPAIWQGWSLAERRRFLRHLRPWWDIHRHRMAPQVAARVAAMRDTGALTLVAGRLDRVSTEAGGLRVTLRARGPGGPRAHRYAAVVNCTGFSSDLQGSRLLGRLAQQGLLRPDPLGLGADVDDEGRILHAAGRPVRGLYAVGPLTRPAHWEAVAVPDLRSHAARVAGAVVEEIALSFV